MEQISLSQSEEHITQDDAYEFDRIKSLIINDRIIEAIVFANDIEMEYWYMEGIEISKSGQELFDKELPGFPMQFTANSEGLKMSFTIIEFNKKFDVDPETYFNKTIPEGYKVMSSEELESMGM